MKYLKLFNTHAEYETFTATTEFVLPNVSHCIQEKDVHYNPWTLEGAYLTFSVKSGGVIKFSGSTAGNSLSYSLNNGEWTTANSGTNITVQSGDTIRWKGTCTPQTDKGIGKFSGDTNVRYDVYGNSMSLLYGDDFKGQTSLQEKNYAFRGLFNNNKNVVSCEELLLPATTLASNCYQYMFSGCTNLSTAPELPATTLPASCYSCMFYGCSGLTEAPELLATTVSQGCCASMFYGCTNLTKAPSVLPATTLAANCYFGMFQNCTSLTTAPELPAQTLVSYCYYGMFNSCSSLNYIKCLALNGIDQSYSTTNWVSGVSSNGIFVMDYNSSSFRSSGLNKVPDGWLRMYLETEITNTITLQNPSYVTFSSTLDNAQLFLESKSSNQTMYISKNATDWQEMNVNEYYGTHGQNLYVCGMLTNNNTTTNYTRFNKIRSISVSGNANSLWNYSNTAATLYAYCGYAMFSGTSFNSTLEFPSTTLSIGCYQSMFYNCGGLTEAPQLPATTLANSCYQGMFQNCTGLTTAPILSATTLANSCYQGMFQGCSGLTVAPQLPATTLAQSCYQSMFSNCRSLTTPPSSIGDSSTVMPASACSYMFSYCSGLTTAPSIPSTSMHAFGYCYYSMFQGCTSLTTAPDLLTERLYSACYMYMFSGCTSLNYIKCLAKNTSDGNSNCVYQWVKGVAASGTFVKNSTMTSWSTGVSGIPNGWTVQDA